MNCHKLIHLFLTFKEVLNIVPTYYWTKKKCLQNFNEYDWFSVKPKNVVLRTIGRVFCSKKGYVDVKTTSKDIGIYISLFWQQIHINTSLIPTKQGNLLFQRLLHWWNTICFLKTNFWRYQDLSKGSDKSRVNL